MLEGRAAEKPKSPGEPGGERKREWSAPELKEAPGEVSVGLPGRRLAFAGGSPFGRIGVCFGKPPGELVLQRGQLFFCGKISPLVGILPQVVKLF